MSFARRLAVAAVLAGSSLAFADANMDTKVKLPARLLTGEEVLRIVHEQTGLRYAYPTGALIRQIDGTPFADGAAVKDIVAKLAGRAFFYGHGGVIALDSPTADADLPSLQRKAMAAEAATPADRPTTRPEIDFYRQLAYLSGNIQTRNVVPLFRLLDYDRLSPQENELIHFQVLRSFDRLERDFIDYHPAGRVSIFQLECSGFETGLANTHKAEEWTSALVKLMKSSPAPETNEWVWAAGIIGRLAHADEPAKTELARGTKSGYERTRKVAEWALSRIDPSRDRKGAGTTGAMPATAVPSQACPPEQTWLRQTAVSAMAPDADLPSAEFVAELQKAVAANEIHGTDAERRASALLLLGRDGGKFAWDTILPQLDSHDPVIRSAAIQALNRCPDPRAVDALVKILIGPEQPAETEPGPEKGTAPAASTMAAQYRNLAAMSLGRIASPAAAKALNDYLASTNKPISSVALALAWMAEPGRDDVEKALIACVAVKDTDEHGQTNCALRGYAYIGLARIGTPAALAAIMSKYNEYDNTARFQGHSSIRLAGAWTQTAVDRFVELLKTGKGPMSAHGLETAEDPRAVDALIAAIPAASRDRLCYAVQALGRIGDPKAVPTLIGLLDHKQQWVAYEAFRALRWRWYFNRPDVQAALTKHPIFGKLLNPPSMKDQPANTWALRHWPIDFDDYRAVNTSYEAGMTFDESTGKVVKVNAHGQRCDAPQLGETWLYDPKTNTWAESKSPTNPFGMCGTWNLTYDVNNKKVVYLQPEGGHHGWQWERARALRGSVPWVYDGEKDTWTPMNPLHMQVGPGMRGFGPMVYIGSIGKVFLHGSVWGGNSPKETASRSWTYDTYTNTWTMLPETKDGPPGGTGQAMCYMPNIDKVVMVAAGKTWLFDPKTSQWADAKVKDMPKVGLPLVYDPQSGTALSFLAESNGTHIVQYDPRANAWTKVDSPVDLSPHHDSVDCVYDPNNNVFIIDGGHVNWETDHIAVREVWTYRFKKLDESTLHGGIGWGTNRPSIPDAVVASVVKDGTVKLSWTAQNVMAGDKEVAGYNLYAATVEAGTRLHHRDVFKKVGEFVKLNKEPIKGTSFTDTRKLAAANGLFNHEIRAYCVKAINDNVRESGPSATVLTLTSSVPRVTAAEQPDGSTLIKWEASPEKDIRGYAIYRMDTYRTSVAVRLNPVPVTDTQFVDWCESPRAERRRYYVVAIDALGQEGIPSTGAWAFGRP